MAWVFRVENRQAPQATKEESGIGEVVSGLRWMGMWRV
jgi:hypothetical protein